MADGPPIAAVELRGATSVDVEALAEGLANRPPEGWLFRDYVRFDDLAVELDRRRIQSYFARRGFFAVQIEDHRVEPAEDPDQVRVVWTLEEGPAATIRAVEILGAPEPLEARAARLVEIEVGARFVHAQYARAKARLRALLVQEGYAHAQVEGTVEVDRPAGEARVRFDLDPGPLVRFGTLIVEGHTRTPTSAVRNRQTWEPGEVFSPDTLQQMRGRLYEVDQYAGIRLDYADETRGPVANIVARVDEAEQNELQLGGGAALDRANVQLRLRGRYLRRSFPFPLTNLEVEATPEYSILRDDLSQGTFTPQARVTWTVYDFLFPRLELENTVGISFRQLEAFSWRGPDYGQSLSRPFVDDRLRAGIGWSIFHYGFSTDLVPEDAARLGVDEGLTVLVLEPTLTFDGRDDILATRSGVFARVGAELGTGVGGATGGYAMVVPDLRGYLPLGERLTLAARVSLAATLTGRLPPPHRFFAGGATSQRGFSQRQLSPYGIAERAGERRLVPLGGETLLETSVEARLRLVRLFGFWLGAVAFVDGADLADDLGDIDVIRQHWAAGGGIRYYTPIGAVRVDVGVRLNRTGEGEPRPDERWAWHLTLGEAF